MRARWLGRVPYAEAWDLQRCVAERSEDEYLLLLEHGHVYTLGAHADPAHVLVDPATVGADVVSVDRGGDVTYHGPGQLVGYPIRTVGAGPHHGPEHVRQVEEVVIGALVALGIPEERVGRLEGYPGVWIDPRSSGEGDAGPRKIAAIGVRTARGRTTHGFALNVSPDLSMFGYIVPCGIADRPVTSLTAEGLSVTMAQAVDAVLGSAREVWGELSDVAAVTDGAGTTGSVAVTLRVPGGNGDGGSALQRRLARSGVDPGSGLPISTRKPEWLRVRATMADGFLESAARHPGPRSRHRVRGGRLPEHLRVLVRWHRHLHDQRVAVHPCVRLLPGGHPSPPPARPLGARSGR